MKVKVTRAFLLGGNVQGIGDELEVSDRDARELMALGKAAPVQPMPAQSGPMTTESTPTLVKGKKGKQDAGE